jgi:hypothetical protein
MVTVHFEREVDLPAQQIWAILEDFGNMAWAEGVTRTEILGEGVGMTRRLHMPGMEPIDEVLESMDAPNMTYSYSIPKGLPLPISDYVATARLEPLDDQTTRITWQCNCTPDDPGMSFEELEAMVHATYNLLVDMVTRYLTRAA